LGILVENKPAAEIEQDIDDGKYDKEIKEEKTEVSAEKKAELEKYFAEVKDKQDKLMKLEEKEKEEKEQAKVSTPEEEAKKEETKEPQKELPKTKKK